MALAINGRSAAILERRISDWHYAYANGVNIVWAIDGLRPSPLAPRIQQRIRNVVSISGLHNLRRILSTVMNERLPIEETEAFLESPALLHPVRNAGITCRAADNERSEFLRQNALLANIWTGLGAATTVAVEPDKRHFDTVHGLADPGHALKRALLSQGRFQQRG